MRSVRRGGWLIETVATRSGPTRYSSHPHSPPVSGRGLHHPWLDAPEQRASRQGRPHCDDPSSSAQPRAEPGRHLPVCNPLVSQPVVEACLSVPSWAWREGGRDRALVRRAFAGTLPAAVSTARVKGTPGRFAAQLSTIFGPPFATGCSVAASPRQASSTGTRSMPSSRAIVPFPTLSGFASSSWSMSRPGLHIGGRGQSAKPAQAEVRGGRSWPAFPSAGPIP